MSKAFCTFHRAATYQQVGHSCNLFIWVLKSLSKFKLGVCQPHYSQGLLLCLAEAASRLLRLMRVFLTADECPASHFLSLFSQNTPAGAQLPHSGGCEARGWTSRSFFLPSIAPSESRETLPGCCQQGRGFSERNPAWHIAAKALVLSGDTDVCEHVVSDGG